MVNYQPPTAQSPENLDDQARTMCVVNDPDMSAPKVSLDNAASRPKRHYSSDDEETTNPHPPKRLSKEDFVKTEPMPSFSPYSIPAFHEAMESNVYSHQLEESERTGYLDADIASRADFDSDVTTKTQSQRAWLIANYEAIREQYHDLVKLTNSLCAIQNDLENYLHTYGHFDVPDPLNSPGYSQPLQNRFPDSFVEGGLNNQLEIRDEDFDPGMDDLPIRKRDVLSGNSAGNSSTEDQESV